jgi:hypothetical protein
MQQRRARSETAGQKICLDCAGNDPELVRQIVHHVIAEMAQKLEGEIKAASIK